MKLIDRDKFISDMFDLYIEQKWKPSDIHFSLLDVRNNIDFKGYEVKAIPIEWLHSIMEKQLIFAMESEMEGTTTVIDGIIHCVSGAVACQVLANVIKLWEKESESRDTESIK